MDTEITLERSEILTRNLIRSAIATLCWIRQIFPDECFEDREMAGMTVKKFRPPLSTPTPTPTSTPTPLPLQLSNRVREWIEEGAFDALRRRYLDAIIFGVASSDRPNDANSSSSNNNNNNNSASTLIESYTIKIDYNATSFSNSFQCALATPCDASNDGLFLSSQTPTSSHTSTSSSQTSSLSSQPGGHPLTCTVPCVRVASYETVKAATIQMLRSVSVYAQTLAPLPPQYCVLMELLYKDAETPPEYQPRHFMQLPVDSALFRALSKEGLEESPMGVVETDYHSVRISIETKISPKTSKYAQLTMEGEEDCEIKGGEVAALLSLRDRVLFTMDVLEDLPRVYISKCFKKRITRQELQEIMGLSAPDTSELLFVLTELGSLCGKYTPNRNIFVLNTTKNRMWTSSPEKVTLSLLKHVTKKFASCDFKAKRSPPSRGEPFVVPKKMPCVATTAEKNRKVSIVENPLQKEKGKFLFSLVDQ